MKASNILKTSYTCSVQEYIFIRVQNKERMDLVEKILDQIVRERRVKQLQCDQNWPFGQFFDGLFSKLLFQLWDFYATGQIFFVVNGQRSNSNIAIWSHFW